jgi:hypothetical protein
MISSAGAVILLLRLVDRVLARIERRDARG